MSELTAEQFQKLSSSEKFALRMKWSADALQIGLSGGDDLKYYRDKINKYDKPLEITIIRMYGKGKLLGEYENIKDIIKDGYNVTEKEVKYFIRYNNKNAGILTFEKVKQVLKGNEYETID